jgi:hypothetical protein
MCDAQKPKPDLGSAPGEREAQLMLLSGKIIEDLSICRLMYCNNLYLLSPDIRFSKTDANKAVHHGCDAALNISRMARSGGRRKGPEKGARKRLNVLF